MYEYCARRLNEAGLKLDVSLIDEVTRLMATIRGGWLGMQAAHG
ncbi:flagellar protein FliS [Paludibacterium denitrificans]|nr:flagellar protein FliS [Paludibacterium denitrificans]